MHGNKPKSSSRREKKDWIPVRLCRFECYEGFVSRDVVEQYLKGSNKPGGFVVYMHPGHKTGTLSQYTENSETPVKHISINWNAAGELYLTENCPFKCIDDLIRHYQKTTDGTLLMPLTTRVPLEEWQIDPNEIEIIEEIGAGMCGSVSRGTWRHFDVAVKELHRPDGDKTALIKEAIVMTKLKNKHVVKLYGVCTRQHPYKIVSEFMCNGSLADYIKKNQTKLTIHDLADMCYQVCLGMVFLEQAKCIHGDLHLGNCLVGQEGIVKIADFGFSRTRKGTLEYTQSYQKADDVTFYGQLLFEVFDIAEQRIPEEIQALAMKCINRSQPLTFEELSEEMYHICENLPDKNDDFRPGSLLWESSDDTDYNDEEF